MLVVLFKLFRIKNDRVRRLALKSLFAFGSPSVDPLIQLLKDNDSFVRENAARALGKI